jgi:hypothetical protein
MGVVLPLWAEFLFIQKVFQGPHYHLCSILQVFFSFEGKYIIF